MYQERQVLEQALRVCVSNRTWVMIVSTSSCGSLPVYEREADVSERSRLKILAILVLLRYQTTLPRGSIPLET